MNLTSIGLRNVRRNTGRTLWTIAGVAVALIAFTLIQTVLASWEVAAKYAAQDRIGTRHKVTFVMTLPGKYSQEINQVPGVKESTHLTWFGAKYPKPEFEKEFFATMAVETDTFLNVYNEIAVPADQIESWRQTRNGALVGDALAKKFGWKVGDKVTLLGTIYPGNWDFTVSGIYTAKRRSIDRSTFWFHFKYLDESLPTERQNQVGWIMSRVQDAGMAGSVSKAIDQLFDNRDIQTLSMSERALNASFLGMLSAVLKALNLVSVVILLIMLLILGNTIAMGVRERTHEYGVLRAIGFLPRHIATFVFGEAVLTGVLGGIVGVGVAYPLVEGGMSRFIEENMGGIFPYFRIETTTIIQALILSFVLGFVAAALPAYRASKLDVIDSLRRVG